MFGKSDIRYILAVVWIVAFMVMWFVFGAIFQAERLNNDLEKIIKGIEDNDWEQADIYTDDFINIYYNKKYIYMLNNSTEMFATFDHSVRQLQLAVGNRQESALEYAGLLREGINYVAQPFSQP